MYPNDRAKPLAGVLDEFAGSLEGFGWSARRSKSVLAAPDQEHAAFEVHPSDARPPFAMYVAALRRDGATFPPIDHYDNIFVVVYEAESADYLALEPTFKASASSLFDVAGKPLPAATGSGEADPPPIAAPFLGVVARLRFLHRHDYSPSPALWRSARDRRGRP